MTFVTITECLNAPDRECLTSPNFIGPVILFLVLALVGAVAAHRDRRRFRVIRRMGLLSAGVILAVSALAIAYFFALDPSPLHGASESNTAEAAWLIANMGVGAGLALLLGVAGYALGGRIVKRKRAPATAAVMPIPLVIAIDGPAASGKGTLAKRIAAHFDLPCLDTGLLYRAVARDVVERGHKLEDTSAAVAAARGLDPKSLDDSALRGPAAGDAASMIAKIPDVRRALLDYQRTFAAQPGGAVLDGRDIGTVVCPNANIKIYVTATPEERARRRHLEHKSRGETVGYDTVLADIRRRDARDSGRDIAPMGAASDAVRLDTTKMDADAAFAAALKVIKARHKAKR